MKYLLLAALAVSFSAHADIAAEVSTPPAYAPRPGKDYKSCLQDYKRTHALTEEVSLAPHGPLLSFLSDCTANPALVSADRDRNKALLLESLKTLTAEVDNDQMVCLVMYQDTKRDMIIPEKFIVSRSNPAPGIASNLNSICKPKGRIFMTLITDWKGN